jgi:DUF971 family protein
MSDTVKIPTGIELHQATKLLDLSYSDSECYQLSCEYLRVYSPSAEVRGHGKGQEVLQTGKIHVAIDGINPVGNYALQLIFSDGHDSGIYSWDYLYQLCTNQEQWWQDYLDQLSEAGATRDPSVQVVRIGN